MDAMSFTGADALRNYFVWKVKASLIVGCAETSLGQSFPGGGETVGSTEAWPDCGRLRQVGRDDKR